MSMKRNAESLAVLLLATGVAVVANCLGAVAQSQSSSAASADELRPVYATSGSSGQQPVRRLAAWDG